MVIIVDGVSSNVWWDGGKEAYCHSRDACENSGVMHSRCDAKASQIRNKNSSIATKEIVEPIEDIVFHSV